MSMDAALDYFRDACHFAETANAMTSKAEVIRVLTEGPYCGRPASD